MILKPQQRPQPLRELFNLPPFPPHKPQLIQGTSNPQQELAAMNAINQYPNAAERVRSINTGAEMENPNQLGSYHPFTTDIKLRSGEPQFDYNESMDILRHELSHAVGLGDAGTVPDAYDISYLSGQLHKDINLPPMGIGPSGKKRW
jgi:hypothetical protein